MTLTKEQVRELRQSISATQEGLAGLMGVTRATVANWESGRAPCIGAAARLLWVLTHPEELRQGAQDDQEEGQGHKGE